MYPHAGVFATDFTWEMVQAGQGRADSRSQCISLWRMRLSCPFADDEFDAVITSFVMRNVVDRRAAFQ